METRKTAKGWVIEITNTVNGCLEQGGVCGRRVLYTRETLAACGIDYDADPDARGVLGATPAEYLARQVEPDRVLRRGTARAIKPGRERR